MVEVLDEDLVGAGTLEVEVASTTEPAGETLQVAENPVGSGVFVGQIDLSPETPVTGDGAVGVADGDVLTATYVDADDGLGGTNVVKTDSASVSCAGSVIFTDGFESGDASAWGLVNP
jgi:hypothetical protein